MKHYNSIQNVANFKSGRNNGFCFIIISISLAMFKLLFQSFRKSIKLKGLSKKLSVPVNTKDTQDILFYLDKKEKYLDELIELCLADEYIAMVMSQYNANGQTLKELYSLLCSAGAGQYAGGHFVAASSLAFPLTLRFLLEHYNDGIFSIKGYDNYNSTLFIAYRLIQYFENGEVGTIES